TRAIGAGCGLPKGHFARPLSGASRAVAISSASPMADPEAPAPGTDSVPSRRHRRRARAHRARRRVITIACAVVAGVVVIALATDTLLSNSPRPTRARAVDVPVVRAAGPPASTTTSQPLLPCRSGLTSDKPLRLWVGGDSLAGSLGPALGKITGAT